MIGLDFPIRPEWIYDIHQLWQPNEPIASYKGRAISQTMQELGGEKTRKNTFAIIYRIFSSDEKSGSNRETPSNDVWPAYSKKHNLSVMAPAYLARLIASSEITRDATEYIVRRFETSNFITSNEVRQSFIKKYGERKVVLNSGSAFIKTLEYFGVIKPGNKNHQFCFNKKLVLTKEIFPLLVWVIWKQQPSPQIDLDEFQSRVELSFLDTSNLEIMWKSFQPELWILSERIDSRLATLKSPDEKRFVNFLYHYIINKI